MNVYEYDIYTGSAEKKNISQIVLNLVKILPFIDQKIPWHIFCDNYFTSVQLALDLLKYGVYITETIRKDRLHYPVELKNNLTTIQRNCYE